MFGRGDRAASADVRPDGVPAGYRDLDVLGHGEFATVYRARDERADRAVALKILTLDGLDARALRRFESECRAIVRASDHPNVVTVHDAGTTPRPWVAMELCPRGSLGDRVEASGPLPVADVVDVGIKLCEALRVAHGVGVLHRDVKPANVLVTPAGQPALTDFGVARLANESEDLTRTAASALVHAAPEVLEGHDAVAASDVYAFGSTLWSLLAGRAPYALEASIGLAPLVTRVLRGEVPALPRDDVPPAVEEALRAALRVHPGDRPADPAALAQALSLAAQGLGAPSGLGAAPPVAVRPRPGPADVQPSDVQPATPPDTVEGRGDQAQSEQWSGRNLLIGIGVIAVLGAVGGVVWWLGGAGDEPPSPPPTTVDAQPLDPGEAGGLSPRQVSVRGDAGRLEIAWLLPDPAVIPYVRITPEVGQPLQLSPGQEAVTITDVEPGTQYCVTVAGLLAENGKLTPVPATGDPVCGTPR